MSLKEIRHIFIWTNRKSSGKGCAAFDSEAVFEYLKQIINNKAHLFKDEIRVKVVKTSCLGRCKLGPNLFISPDNIWYTFNSIDDIDELIDTHFIKGEVLKRCLHKA